MEPSDGSGAYDAAVNEPRDASVVDDNESKPRGAAARKAPVGDDPAPEDGGTDAAAPEPARPRRPRRSRPFWRKGWFWVGVIAAEILVALIVSVAFERSTTEVDLAGGDLTAFCDQARALRDEGATTSELPGSNGTAADDPTPFERERDAYLALIATAPSALVPDLEQLAALDQDLADVAAEIRTHKAEDPSYDGAIAELTSALERASAKGRIASTRVNLVLREECGMAPDPGDVTTTTAPPATGAPTTTPS